MTIQRLLEQLLKSRLTPDTCNQRDTMLLSINYGISIIQVLSFINNLNKTYIVDCRFGENPAQILLSAF